MENKNFQTIQSLGRPALIKALTKPSSFQRKDVVKGVGDDAAVIQQKNHQYTLITSEIFTEGVDFDLTYMPLHHLGYKMMTALVSDIYAMNGEPETASVNLGVPTKISVKMLEKIYEGIYTAGDDYNVQIIGGDLTASHQTLVISVSGTGCVERSNIAYRKGAKVNDAICVSGDLGGAIAGLRILMREKQFWEEKDGGSFEPELEEYEYVVKRQLVPIARHKLVESFHKQHIVPTAMIDISQGLAADLKQLTDSSKVGAYLYQAALPIAIETRRVADEMKEDVDKYALYGGEDFELLFTLPENIVEEFANNFKEITVIGKITEPEYGLKMQTADGHTVHFQENDNKSSNN